MPDLTKFKMKQIAIKNWWIITLKGLITFLIGILTLTLPIEQWIYSARVFGLIILITGLSLVLISFPIRKYNDRSWRLTEGFIDTIIGINILAFPKITPGIFISVLTIWISFMGIIQIMNGYRLRSLFHHWWFLIFNGTLAIGFAVIIFSYPLLETLTKMILIGLQLIVFGGFLVISSLYLKRMIDDIRTEIPRKEGEEGNQELSYY